MRLLRRCGLIVLGLCAGLAMVAGPGEPAQAQWHRDRDIHHFHEHDFDRWRAGRWVHGPHGGRVGWWWVVGGAWYFYPAPVYPYPDPYVPPAVVVAPAPPPAAAAPVPPAQYYFCDRPRGYYPYVAACHVPWRVVLAAP